MADEVTPVTLSSAHGLQGMIELVYVQAANDLLYTKMLPLQSSLSLIQQSLGVLTDLQNLHNQVTVRTGTTTTGAINFDYMSAYAATGYTGRYKSAADTWYNSSVYIYIGDNSVSEEYIAGKLTTAKDTIDNFLIPGLIAGGASEDPNSLIATLRKISDDIGDVSGGPFLFPATEWLLDNSSSTGLPFITTDPSKAGAIQGNITKAVTAAQSFNTTQTEKVRSYLFLFEEFYKSAAAMLSQITQIIQKIASNAGK